MGRRLGPCRGKVRHSCKAHAVIALKKVGNAGLQAYPCARCGGWHLGTSNREHKQQARLDQLFAQIREADARRKGGSREAT